MDDDRAADVYFRYPHWQQAEVVRFALTGCSHLTAPGRSSRVITDTAFALLMTWQPRSWLEG